MFPPCRLWRYPCISAHFIMVTRQECAEWLRSLNARAVSSLLDSCNQLTGSVAGRLLHCVCWRRTDVHDQVAFKGSSKCWLTRLCLADTFLLEYILSLLVRYATENAYFLFWSQESYYNLFVKKCLNLNVKNGLLYCNPLRGQWTLVSKSWVWIQACHSLAVWTWSNYLSEAQFSNV